MIAAERYNRVRRGVAEGRLLVTGWGALERVSVETVPTTLDLSREQRREIPAAVAALRAKGCVVTDGPTYRLESWSVGDSLHLRLSERSYFDSVVLKQNPQWNLRSQVLALVCLTRCQDGYLVEMRSQKVASLAGHLHPLPSGSVEPHSHPLDTLYTEAHEELGLEAHELSEIYCLGLVYGELSVVYQLVCRATTERSLADIESRACSGAWERSQLLCAPADREALSRWLEENRSLLTVGGYTALVMEGGSRWGTAWLEERLEC